ncbi:phage virion morphogenesis protein [Helicobacter sp. 13S00477-4]|uniref:phage virion morphogenesis protein n=1 Tax=Helicobacter sp. 13S00477-4 TaxID=1905759 RepID=UPI000BA5C35F|nr:phage virion morphogenesis protein [Helicobacter sp. 13S00477-4]PAF51296.1 phage virion morphogenesis protein [Helicobacter sp. 13S00477-4]
MSNNKKFQNLIKDIERMKNFEKSEGMRKLLSTTASRLESISDESFEFKQSPFEEKWQDRAKSTKLKLLREKKLSQSDILQVSGHLRRSIHTKIGIDSVILGTNVNKSYAPIHQFGGYAGRGKKVKIPKRAYLPINDKGQLPKPLEKDIETMIWKFLEI